MQFGLYGKTDVLKFFRTKILIELSSLDSINKLVNSNAQQSTNVNVPQQDVKWIPPDYEFLKCNTDASFKKETLQGGLGLIIKDFADTNIAVQDIHINGGMRDGTEVEEPECKAMKEVVALAVKLKLKKVILESDSEVLVKSINGPDYFVHWLYQSLILDIEFMLRSIESWRCISVRRDANSVANKIAKRARIMGVCFNFRIDLPLEIQEWIDQDKPVLD
ncbi:uncharacterized protein LOC113359332 [Papaver somniferum]|uniref:uncharacterized protein LOC113359332 n=1 Tax=Papaver somniferum TaxID=3469 RepID=UPI000E6F5191|nr:uncharacterized protein LOC113359332 [Papaver somniferum]